MEQNVSFPFSHKPAINLYPDPDESTSHLGTLFLWDTF
jgi:hypothetical protein